MLNYVQFHHRLYKELPQSDKIKYVSLLTFPLHLANVNMQFYCRGHEK